MSCGRWISWGIVLLTLGGSVSRGEVKSLDVAKTRWAVQTQPGTCSLAPGNPWVFEADVVTAHESDLSGPPTVSCRTGSADFSALLPFDDPYFLVRLRFDTQAAMDSVCGTGRYVFAFRSRSASSDSQVEYLLSGPYPPFPYLVGGNWENGTLVTDPTKAVVFRWCRPPKRDDLQVQFHVVGAQGSVIGPVYGKADFFSFVVQPGQLAAGKSYTVFVSFFYLVDAPPEDGRGGACMQSSTRIEMTALSPPSS